MPHVATLRIPAQSSTLTDFPVYVDLSTITGDFWSTVTNGGGDIRCYASDGTTQLPREVVSCDTSTNTGELHVKITLSSSTWTEIQIHADGSSTEPAVTSTYGRNAVWSDYDFVSHLDGANVGSLSDSTGNGITFSEVGSGTNTYDASAPVGTGVTTDGNSGLKLSAVSGFSADYTFSVWGNITAQEQWAPFFLSSDNGGAEGLRVRNPTTQRFRATAGNSNDDTFGFLSSLNLNNAAHYVYTRDDTGNVSRFYINGTENDSTTDLTGTTDWSDNNGHLFSDKFNRGFTGTFAELRFRSGVSSADWLAAEYLNQSNPAGFYVQQNHIATLTIDGTTPSATHTDFPKLIRGEDFPAGVWSTATASGGDIRIFLSDGTTEVAREIVSFDNVAEEAEIWALIPELTAGLSGTNDTVLQIHADGVSSDYAATDTYGSQAVWVDYGYVSHDGGITESTGNASAPTLDGTSAATGKIGDATEFNGSADEVRVPFNAAFGNVFASGGTFTAWARSDSNGVNSDFGRLFQIENSAGQAAPYIGIAGDDSDELQFITRSGGAFANWIGSTNLVSASGFQHLAVSYDGSSNSNNPLMWVNGVSETVTKNVSPGSFMETATNDLYIGNRDGGDRGFDGVIDEFRLIDTELSSFWIADEYSDQDGDSDWHNITAVTSGYSISLDAGTVVLAGQTVDFDYTPNVNSYFIDLEAGTVSLVGDEINLLSQRTIGLEAGEVALDGQAVTLTYNQILNSYTIDLDAGTVTLSGGDIETALARALIAEAGTLQLGGAEVYLRRQALLELDAGEIELSGAEIELAKQVFILLEAGEISLASAALELQKASLINLEAGDVVIDGQDISLSALGNAKVISTLGILHAQNGGGGGTSAEVGSEPPSSPSEGDLWYDTDSGQSYIFVNDGSSSQWAPVNPPLGGSTGQGFADYNDSATSTTPVSITADVWEEVPNDGLGAFTNTGFIPATVSSLFSNNKIDVTDLDLGDAIIIRYDFTLTPSINGAFGELRLSLGSGLGSYYLNRPIGTLSNGSGYDYQVTGEFYIYMGDANTRDTPIGLEVRCSEDASLVNAGVVIQVIKR